MTDKDPTNPGLQNPLAFIGVSEQDCRDRTKAITDKIDTVQNTLNTHLVKQQGRKEGIAAVFQWGKWIVVVATLLGLLWAAVSFLEKKAAAIAKANGYHPQPTVEYAAEEEDP